jgi:hypothetical protein
VQVKNKPRVTGMKIAFFLGSMDSTVANTNVIENRRHYRPFVQTKMSAKEYIYTHLHPLIGQIEGVLREEELSEGVRGAEAADQA